LATLPFVLIKYLYKLVKELFFKFFGPFRPVIEFCEKFVRWFVNACGKVLSFFGIKLNF